MTQPTAIIAPPAPSASMLNAGKQLAVTSEKFYDIIEATYSESEREVLAFWFDLAKDRNWGLSELAKQTGASTTTLTRLFRGIYEGSAAAQIEKLALAKANWSEVIGNPDFIRTSLSRKMFEVFDKTRALKNVTIMWGPMGIGKTTVIKEYARIHNHGKTFAVRCPGHGCTTYQFVTHVAKAMRVSTSRETITTMREKIAHMLAKGTRLLIIDELHEIFRTCNADTIVRICEWLREVQETSDCGLALTGTELLHKEFFKGVHKDVLAQLVDRGTVQIPLGAKPTKGDVLGFMKHYGLAYPDDTDPDALAIVEDIIKASGLRKLTLHLRDGAAYANKRQEAYTWDHFTAAFTAIQSLGK